MRTSAVVVVVVAVISSGVAHAENVARQGCAEATSHRANDPPQGAIDGNIETRWNAKGWPLQSITLVFPRAKLHGYCLLVGQTPNCRTRHELVFTRDGKPVAKIAREGYTRKGDRLAGKFKKPFLADMLTITTVQSKSWPVWFEVCLFDASSDLKRIDKYLPVEGDILVRDYTEAQRTARDKGIARGR